MAGLTGYLPPPQPISHYQEHGRYQWYYKKATKTKSGQPWDLFEAWGQERTVGERKGDELEIMSSRLRMDYKALSPTLPSMTPNRISEEFINPCHKIRQDQLRLWRARENISHKKAKATTRQTSTYSEDLKTLADAASEIISDIKTHHKQDLRRQLRKTDDLVSGQEEGSSDSKCRDNIQTDGQRSELDYRIDLMTSNHPDTDRLLSGLDKDESLFEDIVYPHIPLQYIGGCTSVSRSDRGQNYIAYVFGPQLSRVRLKKIKMIGNFTKMSAIATHDHGESIKQVELVHYGQEWLTAVRSGTQVAFYSVEESILECKDSIALCNIRHLSLNPHYPECVFVNDEGTVHRWSEHTQLEKIVTNWSPRFDVEHDNRTVHYGCNPSQLVLTDMTVCSLYDIRSHKTCLDLFEIPSNTLLHEDERLIMSAPGRDSIHHILSHHTLLSVDERFTKYPVLYQVLPCLSWPSLMSCASLDSTRDVLTVGCATNQEVFSVITEAGSAVLSSTPVWKVSQPSDVCYFDETRPSLHTRGAAVERLGNSGLIGLSVSQLTDDTFTIHMMNGCGDLFEQTYQHSDTNDANIDVTLAAGPRLSKPTHLSSEIAERCLSWYDSLSTRLSSKPDDETIVISKAITIPTGDLPKANKHCALCRGPDVKPSTDDMTAERCLRCGSMISSSSATLQSILAKQITEQFTSEGQDDWTCNDPPNIAGFNINERAGEDPNSNVLLKLWYGEDLTEVLGQRDKEWDERREKVNAENMYEGELAQSEIDAISSISGTSRRTAAKPQSATARSHVPSVKLSPRKSRNSAGNIDAVSAVGSVINDSRAFVHSSLNVFATPATPTSAQKRNRPKKSRKGF